MKIKARDYYRTTSELLKAGIPVLVHGRRVHDLLMFQAHGGRGEEELLAGRWYVVIRCGEGDDTSEWAKFEFYADDFIDTDELAVPL